MLLKACVLLAAVVRCIVAPTCGDPALLHTKLGHSKVATTEGYSIAADDIAVSIITSAQEPYIFRGNLVHETWASYFDAFEAFTFDANHPADFVKRVDKYGPNETTSRATGMNLAMIPAMLNMYPDAKWYLQADDDSLLVPHQWLSAAEGLDWRTPSLAGKCVGYPPDDVAFVVGGAGILISRSLAVQLAPHVLECRQKFNHYDYGDARIGACMREVMGPGYGNSIFCLPGATNQGLYLDGNLLQRVLSIHQNNRQVFEYVWSHVEPDIAARHEITWAALKALKPHVDELIESRSAFMSASSQLIICPDPPDIQTWPETCKYNESYRGLGIGHNRSKGH